MEYNELYNIYDYFCSYPGGDIIEALDDYVSEYPDSMTADEYDMYKEFITAYHEDLLNAFNSMIDKDKFDEFVDDLNHTDTEAEPDKDDG